MMTDLPHCPVPGEIMTIAAAERSLAAEALSLILEPFQPLREQLIAITGLGLEQDSDAVDPSLRRLQVVSPVSGGPVSLLAAGQPDGQRVIFIHGSPGLGEEWMAFLADVPEGLLYLAPDRPGFGNSGDTPVTDLQDQADSLHPLLGPSTQPPVVVVGYSYGGPVALRLAADRPDRVAGVLLVGAAADPALEEVHPLQEVAALAFFEQFLPSELASSNAELLDLRGGLEILADDLGNLSVPVTIIQGSDDTLVPAMNVDYLRAKLPVSPATVMLESADHFLPWTHTDLLAQALACLLANAADYVSGEDGPLK